MKGCDIKVNAVNKAVEDVDKDDKAIEADLVGPFMPKSMQSSCQG